MSAHDDLFGPVIHAYTREQALADGYLIDVTETAREAGFSIPVAVTAAVWADCVAWDDVIEARKPEYTGQDEQGRLWDVVFMARHAASVARATSRLNYRIARIPAEGRGVRPRDVNLTATISGGDTGEPVITIHQPTEA